MNRTQKNIQKNTIRKWLMRGALLLFLLIFCCIENNWLEVSFYRYCGKKIDQDLDGYRIVQISDLHNATFGKNNKYLLGKIETLQPDMIVLTGDLIDSNHTNVKGALSFAKAAAAICPVYYVTGNHEYWLESEELEELLHSLEQVGVMILDNEAVTVNRGTASMTLIGLDDNHLFDATLSGLIQGKEENLSVVLAHEPQYLSYYAGANADLVLTGHAHGGQFRIPGFGGLVAPGQGFFPEYTEGSHHMNQTEMIISRGLGNSVIPVRFCNRPEIVCVDLKSES